jgi:hypothetical protein
MDVTENISIENSAWKYDKNFSARSSCLAVFPIYIYVTRSVLEVT